MVKNRISPERSTEKRKTTGKSSHSNFFVKPKKRDFSKSNNQHTGTKRDKQFKLAKNKCQNLEKTEMGGSRNKSECPTEETETKPTKKPFDKKTYRFKKYSKKYKLQQWEDTRKKAVLKEFYQQVKEPDKKIDVTKIYDDIRNRDSDDDTINNKLTPSIIKEATEETGVPIETVKKRVKPFQRAREEFRRIKENKKKSQEEFLRAKAEKEEALKKYRREKAIKYKRLSRKTKKGQPIMKDRIEMLLEKIQNSSN